MMEGERRSRRWKKEGFDMRKASSQRESEMEVEEMKRRNQEVCGWGEERESGCGGLRRVEREWEVDEIRESRRRDWEGRRVRSFCERKDCAVVVTSEINVKRLLFWFFSSDLFFVVHFPATMAVVEVVVVIVSN